MTGTREQPRFLRVFVACVPACFPGEHTGLEVQLCTRCTQQVLVSPATLALADDTDELLIRCLGCMPPPLECSARYIAPGARAELQRSLGNWPAGVLISHLQRLGVDELPLP